MRIAIVSDSIFGEGSDDVDGRNRENELVIVSLPFSRFVGDLLWRTVSSSQARAVQEQPARGRSVLCRKLLPCYLEIWLATA